MKLKQAVFDMAVDLTLKNIKRDPVRCARNLSELIAKTYPEKKDEVKSKTFLNNLINLCKQNDTEQLRAELEKYSKET